MDIYRYDSPYSYGFEGIKADISHKNIVKNKSEFIDQIF